MTTDVATPESGHTDGPPFARSTGYLPSLPTAEASGGGVASQRSHDRDNTGKEWHVVALSGGKDSSALALRLMEVEPRDYLYVCTPTGDELPEMWDWWKQLGVMLGKQIKPVMEMTLKSCLDKNGCLPNFRRRFCTRQIKIEPFRRFVTRLTATGTVTSYVGLRADEEGRAGGAYDSIQGVNIRYPLREWGWGVSDVLRYLAEKNVKVPKRTDCARCYHQRIGEWWELWKHHPDLFADAIADEERFGETYRSPGRDTWPVDLKTLGEVFAGGRTPKSIENDRETMKAGGCRVCTM